MREEDRPKRVGYWGVLCVAVALLGVGFQSCNWSRRDASEFKFIGDTSEVRGVWLSRNLDALWLRRDAGGEWRVGEAGEADAGQVHSLLEILGALRLGVELSARGSDSLRSGLAGEGLQVLIEYDNGSNESYTLFLPAANRPCVYSQTLKQGWTVEILGFDEAFIADLSLRREDWYAFSLGVQRPSDLRAVELAWRDDLPNSFAMQIGDGYATRVVSLADSTRPVECDTARVSVFLHSLTSLRSFAPTSRQNDSLRAWLDSGRFDCTLSLQLQAGDTLIYDILLSMPHGQGDSLTAAGNVGVLRTERGEFRRFILSDWDVTLLPLSYLIREEK